jgi:hypothetical protein
MGLRITRAEGPLTERWRDVPIEQRGAMRLGISFRPLQAEGLGLEPQATLDALLEHRYEVIRLMHSIPRTWIGRSKPPSARASR